MNFLNFRLHAHDLEEEVLEHDRYKNELKAIKKNYAETSDVGQKVIGWLKNFKNDKNSKQVNHFWSLQVERRNIFMEIKLLEEKSRLLEKQQNELEYEIDLEQTRHILVTTRETRNQGVLLQKEVTKKIENRGTRHKRAREEKKADPPNKRISSGKRGDTLPDGTKIKKPASLNLLPSDDDDDSSEEHDDSSE
ncbi:hypothetical protein C1645_71821 [Glomus cerebriforme]|uniref:Uncharacterized protein n=1 Tax=Glomus cerebriforme TaxID=658196 RepID=A0A397S0L8_9GLOM|nr:hypothetical protein C1645_71821 [Glomus cerebriforme]